MVTVKQGKQIASLFNSYQVACEMATKALEKGNMDSFRNWTDSADIASLVLNNHFNITLPTHEDNLKSQIGLYGWDKTAWRIAQKYECVTEYHSKKVA